MKVLQRQCISDITTVVCVSARRASKASEQDVKEFQPAACPNNRCASVVALIRLYGLHQLGEIEVRPAQRVKDRAWERLSSIMNPITRVMSSTPR